MAAEGHARLAAPLWNMALVLIALVFLLRGQHSKLGNGRKIAICAVTGFIFRLVGFAVASSAEGDPALNPLQYVIPLLVILTCIFLLSRRKRTRFGQTRRKKSYMAAKAQTAAAGRLS